MTAKPPVVRATRSRPCRGAVLVLAFGALVGGCASNAGGGGSANDEGSVAEWCDALSEQGRHSVPPAEDPEIDRLVEVAPDEIRDASEMYRDWAHGRSAPDIRDADAEIRAYAEEHC